MTRKKFLYTLSAITIGLAIALTVLLPLRYGQHQDNIRCGEGETHKNTLSITGYYVFNDDTGSSEGVGTCPYSLHTVKTYAAEVWLVGIVLLLLGSRATKRATHTMPGSAI